MGLRHLDHFLILTDDPEATRDWFCNNLGMTSGFHPDFGFPVYWLYLGEKDVIHVAKARHSAEQDSYMGAPGTQQAALAAGAMGSGRVDHVCFSCDGLTELMERLTRNGIEFNERKAHNATLYQLFLREPVNGIKVELNFSAEEAIKAGRVSSWDDEVKA